MACRLIEGWESSTSTADYTGKWTTLPSASPISSSFGRFGNGLRTNSAAAFATRTLDAQGTWVMGAAVRHVLLQGASVFSVLTAGTVQAGLGLNPNGTLFVYRSSTSTVLGTTTAALAANVWHYVEWRVTIGNTGSSVVRIDGAEVLSLPSVDTQAHASTSTADQVRLGPGGTSAEVHYDDVYVFDATGSVNTAFAGDCRVAQLLPTGAGATSAWTPSAGSNFQCVDEVPPNSDTDFVSSAAAGATDSYAFEDLALTGAVKAVQATVLARKDDAGSRSVALVARPGSTDRVGATQAVGDSYARYTEVWNTNPDTSAAWTVADLNTTEFGQRLIA